MGPLVKFQSYCVENGIQLMNQFNQLVFFMDQDIYDFSALRSFIFYKKSEFLENAHWKWHISNDGFALL